MKREFQQVSLALDGDDYILRIDMNLMSSFDLYEAETERLLAHVRQTPYRFSRATVGPHPKLLLRADGIKPYYVALRTLPVPGTQNLRDIGGYRGQDGRQVRYGMLFRSDQLSRLDDAGIAYLRELKIRTIIDLRSLPEIAKSPNQKIGAITIHCDPSAETAELAASFQADAENEDRLLVGSIQRQLHKGYSDPGMLLQYRRFATESRCISAFRSMMETVCKADAAPLLFHCRGGKDRTGFAAMVILGALGVSDEEIICDYMLTQKNRAGRTTEKMEQYRHYTSDPAVLEYLQTLLDCSPDYIQASLDEIYKRFQSMEQYIESTYDIPRHILQKFKNMYLY